MAKRKEAMSTLLPSKTVKLGDHFQFVFPLSFNQIKYFFYRSIGQIKNENVIEFFVRLCGDVMFEVLRYANRRRLTKLARIGLRFHSIVENFFGEMPFLRLNLILLEYIFFSLNYPKFIIFES